MAGLLESVAHFKNRATEIGIREGSIEALETLGLNTLGSFGFSFGQPGQQISGEVFQSWLDEQFSEAVPIAEVARLKRLLFEAHVLITAHLKSQVETSSSDAVVRKIPPAERAARLALVSDKIKGVDISGCLMPAHSLLDEVVHQAESQVLKYLKPSKCPSRESEVLSAKPEKEIAVEQNALKLRDQKPDVATDTSSEFLVYQALVRRCVAYEFARLIDFETQHKWVSWLFKMLTKPPPPGYNKISMAQILACDQAAFAYMAEHCPDLRHPDRDAYPLQKLMADMSTNFEVMIHAQPLPRPASSSSGNRDSSSARVAPYQKTQQKKDGKGKSKGKTRGPPMPRELVGNPTKDAKGRNICFAYNLPGGCNGAPPGEMCPRGAHVCIKAGCHQLHSFQNHKSGN